MEYTTNYHSPLGDLLLAGDEEGLTGLWFEGAKYHARTLDPKSKRGECPAFKEARKWLELYFAGKKPDFLPPLHLKGSPFQLAVWDLLLAVPYGQTTTYGALASQIAAQQSLPRMSAQAVGGAVGHNPISIIVPCHRVLGSDGSLTGYAGGTEKKEALLTLEGAIREDLPPMFRM